MSLIKVKTDSLYFFVVHFPIIFKTTMSFPIENTWMGAKKKFGSPYLYKITFYFLFYGYYFPFVSSSINQGLGFFGFYNKFQKTCINMVPFNKYYFHIYKRTHARTHNLQNYILIKIIYENYIACIYKCRNIGNVDIGV
jgi:hypothetical protein